MKSGRALIGSFQKMRIKNLRGVSEVRFKKKLHSFNLETSKNHLIRNFLRNRRLRVKLLRAENRRALKIRSRNCRIGLKNYKKSEDLNKINKNATFSSSNESRIKSSTSLGLGC